ncbi:MAG TPA: thiamine phosphate synthase [Jiangellaceae bacterium]|nr:thiamine phosphate synthase [Jiangellaceae bacterium]
MTGLDLRLYVVTDPALTPPDRLVEACLAAVRGGATVVQLRDKEAPDGTLLAQAEALRAALAPHGVPLIVNDRIDVARRAGAGVHLGIHDQTPAAARAVLGPDAIVGWSVEDPAQLAATEQLTACSYLAASPVWVTPTKRDTAPPIGPDGVAGLRARITLPLIGIGGINTPNRVAAVIAAGADGVACVSAVFGAPDPEAAAAALRHAVDATLAERSVIP